jgi:hypothetical protein
MSEIIRIYNIANYTQEIIDGDLILTPIIKVITSEKELLNNYSFNYFSILECIIINNENKEIFLQKKQIISAMEILIEIWKSMPKLLILQKTTFNFKLTNENGNNDYYWCPQLLMSYQNKNYYKGAIIEILKMCNVNNYSIDIKIKLSSDQVINFIKND